MNKIKSPLVKVLRKAGYSTKEAMNITYDAMYAYGNQKGWNSKAFNNLAGRGCIGAMFDFVKTSEGIRYWGSIWKQTGLKSITD